MKLSEYYENCKAISIILKDKKIAKTKGSFFLFSFFLNQVYGISTVLYV